MVVEDDPNIQGFAQTVLEGAGFDVKVCGTAAQARQTFKLDRPDLVLLDIGLPDGTGLDLCTELGLGAENGVPALFMTARGDLNTRIECFKAGGYDYIQKPFAIQELLARINVQLKLKRSRDELINKNQQLELLNRIRQDVTDMIAHDLKAPLSSIKGSIELIKLHEMIDEKQYKLLLDQADTAADFMLLMVNDLLDISQAQQVGLKVELRDVELEALFKRLADLFEGRCRVTNIAFEHKVAPELSPLRTDGNLLFRVLSNLIFNAIKYSRKGNKVELEGRLVGSRRRFMVSDRGPGVPDSEKKAIFEKFVTIDRKSNLLEQSTGIGLAFCKLAAETLNGRIWVENREGGGAVFILEL